MNTSVLFFTILSWFAFLGSVALVVFRLHEIQTQVWRVATNTGEIANQGERLVRLMETPEPKIPDDKYEVLMKLLRSQSGKTFTTSISDEPSKAYQDGLADGATELAAHLLETINA
jgi:hypothetical protein